MKITILTILMYLLISITMNSFAEEKQVLKTDKGNLLNEEKQCSFTLYSSFFVLPVYFFELSIQERLEVYLGNYLSVDFCPAYLYYGESLLVMTYSFHYYLFKNNSFWTPNVSIGGYSFVSKYFSSGVIIGIELLHYKTENDFNINIFPLRIPICGSNKEKNTNKIGILNFNFYEIGWSF